MGQVLWHWLVFFFALVSLSRSLSSDGLALLALSETLMLPSSISSNWNAHDRTPCKWKGVSCDRKKNVTSVDLSSAGVSGTLGPHIGLMKRLQALNLARNNISGSIPPELGNCTAIRDLDLSENFLSGEIPASLSNLEKLSALSLYSNSLNGKIPEELFKNKFLEEVYLDDNKLSGSIPLSIGDMSSLRFLSLLGNMLSGVLPDSIGNCTMLEELYLSDNQLSGSLPKTLSNIEGLRSFDVTNNSFTGEISFSFENCKLEVFILSFNHISGEIPAWLGYCNSLTQLAFVNNSLSGQIPTSIGLLSNLSYLLLSQNSLSGPIPPEIGNCRMLVFLELDANQLEGTTPKELANLSDLKKLFLFSNHLAGEFPKDIWGIRSLESVLIYDNGLYGQLPPVLSELKHLQNITLADNFFTGVIPQGLGVNSSLLQIDFTNNSFVGGIPPGICSGKRLRILDLGFNLLNGSIPSNVADCPSLERVIIQNNNLNGPIPQFGNCVNLSYIDLSYNSLSGHIPESLGKCAKITMINWSGNKLSGPIPPDIGKLLKLQRLKLSDNSLQGALPAQISGCSNLFLLDLSFNSLNGSVLTTVSSLKSLSQLRLQGNKFSGGIPDSLSQLNKLIELQLGGNDLGGGIPSSLGTLLNLDIALNLSSNGLTGYIPALLGNLVRLQRLDLSLNNLTGGLAPLGNLRALHAFNVSYNRFSGPVPENILQFLNSTPNSFDGNPDLCVFCHTGDSFCKGANVLKPCGASRKRGVHSGFKIAIIVIGSLFAGAVVVLILICIFLKSQDPKTKIEGELTVSHLFEGSSSKLNEVIDVTENFNEKYVIGTGAHGTVYKAILRSGEIYAVKKIVFAMHKGSNTSMIRELKTLGKIRHRNLIKLKQFWLRSEYGLILYDFMENGSLHDVLHGTQPAPILEWSVRYNIAIGTAHGLAYLHNDCRPVIIHRDIKPSNILLNKDMEPHISDFGIAKLIDQSSAAPQTTGLNGTVGYMAPEMAFSTRSTIESDVYSYGVVLLELITRKMAVDPSFPDNMDIVTWVSYTLNGSDQIEAVCDPGLTDEVFGTVEMEEVRKLLSLALRCAAKEVRQRPSMINVVKELMDARHAAGSFSKQGKSASRSLQWLAHTSR